MWVSISKSMVSALHSDSSTSLDSNLQRNGSFRKDGMRIDAGTDTPRAFYGLQYQAEGVDDPTRIADIFLREHLSVMKVDHMSSLENFITKETPAGASVRYHQLHNGLEVYGSNIVVTVNKKNAVSFVSSSFKSNVNVPSIQPRVTEKSAFFAAKNEIGIINRNIEIMKAKLIIFVDKQSISHLGWSIKLAGIKDQFISFELIYDAITGENLQIKNLIQDKKERKQAIYKGSIKAALPDKDQDNYTKKNLRGLSSTSDLKSSPDGEASIFSVSPKNKKQYGHVDVHGYVFDPNPLASAKAKYTDPGFADNFDFNSARLNAQTKKVTLRDVTFSGIRYSLNGPYASYEDFDQPKSCDSLLYSEFSTFFPIFFSNRQHEIFESVNIYYHIDTMMRYINEDLGIDVTPFEYSGGVIFDPSGSNGMDNSYYDLQTQRLSFGKGGVDDGEDSDVIVHELAHGIQDWLTVGGYSYFEGLSEVRFFIILVNIMIQKYFFSHKMHKRDLNYQGFADYLAVSYSRSRSEWTEDDEEYYWVFPWDGHNEFWDGRVVNYDRKYPDGLTNKPHIDGQIFSSCCMKIWDALGREKSDKVVLIGMSYTGELLKDKKLFFLRNYSSVSLMSCFHYFSESFSSQDDAANAILAASRDLDYGDDDVSTIENILDGCGYSVFD